MKYIDYFQIANKYKISFSLAWLIISYMTFNYNTGGPLIVPFYVLEKYGVMRNSTMQDILYSAMYV